MTARSNPLSAAEQADLGRLIALARDAGAPWKVLQRELGMERTQLWRCLAQWEAMQQKNEIMQHQTA